MNTQTITTTWKERYAYWLFWSWNLIFLAFMVFGFAPRILPELIREVRIGTIPVAFLFYGFVLSVIPLLAVILGITALRRAPGRLFAMGYVVEGPLMLILIVRFFVIRQATPALVFLLGVACLGMAGFLWHVIDPDIERRSRWTGYLRLFGLTLMLLTSLYAAVWMSFYALPLLGMFFNWLGTVFSNLLDFFRDFWTSIQDLIRQGWAWIPLTVLGVILLIYTLSLFVIAPVVIPLLSGRAWLRVWRELTRRSGRLGPLLLVSITVLATSALFAISNRQPQKRAFAMLSKPPANQQEAQELIKNKASIRSGLLNAYLAPFRYFSARGEVKHIRGLFETTFDVRPSTAIDYQLAYESIASPLLYDPVHPQTSTLLRDNVAFQREPQEAEELYQRFFDTPITEGERETIVNAVRSTWSANEAEAAWQAVDDREVYLEQQEINLQEHDDWAEVEILEIYSNQTNERQEVIYYFNLPESAVLTGLWLGETPNRNEAYDFQIAPRGAAQAVYRNEVRRNIDPALLEQIGPRQYRLRAFPVPPIRIIRDDNRNSYVQEEAPPIYLWLTYRTMAQGNTWPLPQLAYKRNVYWDADTLRLVNGERAPRMEDAWLPDSLPASGSISALAHRVDYPSGQSVLAVPEEQVSLPELPQGLQLATVLDRSYSMETNAQMVSETFSQLSERIGSNNIDVYLTSSPYRGEEPSITKLEDLNADDIVYFGGQNASQLLVQFTDLRDSRFYDAVLVLTDGSGYELEANEGSVPLIEAPVWMIHMGGDIPLGYDDATLDAIQASGGGVAGDLDTALERLALGLSYINGSESEIPTRSDDLDGYLWSVLPTTQVEDIDNLVIHSPEDGFNALAARQLILAESRLAQGEINDLARLDELHALAQEYGIITPYSSMIVLVNLQQEFLLGRLSGAEDRFQREQEALKDTMPATQTPLTGVPEPEEWLLIGLALALLIWYAYRQRYAIQRG